MRRHIPILLLAFVPLIVSLVLIYPRARMHAPERITIQQFVQQGTDSPWIELHDAHMDEENAWAICQEKSKRIESVYIPLRIPGDEGPVHLLLREDRSSYGFWVASGLHLAQEMETAPDGGESWRADPGPPALTGSLARLGDDRRHLTGANGLRLADDCRVLDQTDASYRDELIFVALAALWTVFLLSVVYLLPLWRERRKRLVAATPAAPRRPATLNWQYKPFFYLALPALAASLVTTLLFGYVYVTNVKPTSVALADYSPELNTAEYLSISGVYYDLRDAICVVTPTDKYGSPDGLQYFVPMRTDRRDDTPIRAFLEIRDPARVRLCKQLAEFHDDPEGARAFETENAQALRVECECTGLRDWSPVAPRGPRNVIQKFFATELHRDYTIIEENAAPGLVVPIMFAIASLILAVVCHAAFRLGWPVER